MSPLEEILRSRIAASGPVTVAEYMALALGHPEHGYYICRDPLGTGGDFVTAPEISQVFGELIGLWAAVTWQQMSSPSRIALVECGPGRGTLMSDALRAATTVPAFAAAIELHLVETSPVLRARQKEVLSPRAATWHASLDTLPESPLIVIANEFFDALPVRQFERTDTGWAERHVIWANDGFSFVLGDVASPDDMPDAVAVPGDVLERSPASVVMAEDIGRRIDAQGGAALVIDYGHAAPGYGDTLQAVRGHAYADPLAAPGEADLTAHVDFSALADGFRRSGAAVFGPVTQGEFLIGLGIAERTEILARSQPDERAAALRTATGRLIDSRQMGRLFKVLAATARGAAAPAGFEE